MARVIDMKTTTLQAAGKTVLTTRFASGALEAARLAGWERHHAGEDVTILGWRFADGAEVLRVNLDLYVAEPSGRLLTQLGIPRDVPICDIVSALRAA